jgi:amino acid adenylation domain-containing protein
MRETPASVRTLTELVDRLRTAGIRIWAADHQLRYEAPAGALSPELLGEMRARKEELLGFLRSARDGGSRGWPAIPRVPRGDAFPLSMAQQRLWFLYHRDNGLAYNVAKAVRLRGSLDVDALERALQAVIARHETLRTALETRGGEPVQVIRDRVAFEVARDDLSRAEVSGAEGARALVAEEARRPFDLSRPPFLRARVVRLGEDDHVLVLVLHHVVADGRSLEILFEETAALYGAALDGLPSPLAPLPIGYADYAVFEREWLRGAEVEQKIAWWRDELAGAPPLLELPTAQPRPPVRSFIGGMEHFVIPAGLAGALRARAREAGATLYMTFLAGLAALLCRYSGQEEVCIGCPVENRPSPETSKLIGVFVNTVVLRLSLQGNPTFPELLGRVRHRAFEAYERQDVPFERLVQVLQPERSLAATPVFQIAVSWLDGRKGFPSLPGVQIEPFEFEYGSVKFDLDLEIYETDEELHVAWFYDSTLFERSTIRRMIGHFQRLLQAAVSDPSRPVGHLPMLGELERRTILEEWSGVATEYPRNIGVHSLFAEEAARRPEAIALVESDRSVTYGELDRRGNRLAARLRAQGIGRGAMVALSAGRSIETVVGMLGILKAGAVYVPIDPTWPAERVAFMLGDADVTVSLTPAAITEATLAPGGGTEGPVDEISAEAAAYVMYTSGSTGAPKGSRIPHRAIVRLVRGTNYVTLDENETILQLAPISFDASTFEIWGALLNGARLVIAPTPEPSLAEIGALIRRHQVTTMWLTASLFHLMVDERLEDLAPLRQLLAGGEALALPQVLRAAKRLEHGRVVNGYGPTENTTFTCCHTVDPDRVYRSSIPIGRPIANTFVYVLDRYGQPVPAGVPGELYAGGDGLALDYLNRPDLTRQRFVPNPFRAGRLYRTGDTVRWLPDGSIEFLGRVDDQVKIRGFRVEPAEVEGVLARHPGVSACVVGAHSDGAGVKSLVAYFAGPAEAAGVREFVRGKLPPFMVPAVFIRMEALPLTPSGKVDRRALPAPDAAHLGLQPRYVPPATPVETALCRLWADVLRLERVGRHDNFFEIGGESLKAMRVISRTAGETGVDLPLGLLFEKPTVAELAEAVTLRRAEAAGSLEGILSEIEAISEDEARRQLES